MQINMSLNLVHSGLMHIIEGSEMLLVDLA